jgi:hypothetical protein
MEGQLILFGRPFTVNAFLHLLLILIITVHIDLHLGLHTQHLVGLAHTQAHRIHLLLVRLLQYVDVTVQCCCSCVDTHSQSITDSHSTLTAWTMSVANASANKVRTAVSHTQGSDTPGADSRERRETNRLPNASSRGIYHLTDAHRKAPLPRGVDAMT